MNTVVLRQGDGTDTINGFQLEQTTFSLADGLMFGSLEFQQRQGFSEVIVGDQVLARVVETSVANLSLETNYVMAKPISKAHEPSAQLKKALQLS